MIYETGDIKGFPMEVIYKMQQRQVEQGNVKSLAPFERRRYNDQDCGGFNFSDTPEGFEFWYAVVYDRDFRLFFKKYPQPTQLKLF